MEGVARVQENGCVTRTLPGKQKSGNGNPESGISKSEIFWKKGLRRKKTHGVVEALLSC